MESTYRTRARFNLLIEFLLIGGSLLIVYPFINLVLSSFKKKQELFNPISWPSSVYLGNYAEVFKRVNIIEAFGNTVYICLLTLVLIVIFSSMAGYVISREGKGMYQWILYFFVSGFLIPFQTSMVTLYKLAVWTHLMDTMTWLVLTYAAGSIPFALLIYVGFTKSIPRELEEAAIMDGCSQFRMFWKIIFPLLMPATGTVVAMTIMWYWNDLIGPVLFINDKHKLTLVALVNVFRGEHTTDWGPIFALCVLSSLPLVILFFFTQKYFLQGLIQGAVKG
ncbi:carbohydrate ABC transporter permease [Paenibacillus roseipurpureus]|uniref:Carbohydrate ABC transporter permease n=1 Tax=Paenibacillus roseopurpureus TaxID=2918901 RepID=A0AA96RM06_9BACL|nr:carbohydrate ABC transporter permease [Paenibacillus sp. MBLB1832]WNR45964.1 carbohydrate ABC transporter permease [Paenibacillus sp. MBLB1832]